MWFPTLLAAFSVMMLMTQLPFPWESNISSSIQQTLPTSWTVKLVIVQDEELCDFVLWTKDDWVKSLSLEHHKHTQWNHKKCGFKNPSSHCFTTLAGCCFAEKEARFPTAVGLKGALQEMMGKPSPTSYPSPLSLIPCQSTWYRGWLTSTQWDGDCKRVYLKTKTVLLFC